MKKMLTIEDAITTMAKTILLSEGRGDALVLCDKVIERHNAKIRPTMTIREVQEITEHIKHWENVKKKVKVLTIRLNPKKALPKKI